MPPLPSQPHIDAQHMLPEHAKPPQKNGVGPMVGVVIIVILLVMGGLYFWGAELNKTPEPLPLIPGDSAAS